MRSLLKMRATGRDARPRVRAVKIVTFLFLFCWLRLAHRCAVVSLLVALFLALLFLHFTAEISSTCFLLHLKSTLYRLHLRF